LLRDLQREARHDRHWTAFYKALAMFSSCIIFVLISWLILPGRHLHSSGAILFILFCGMTSLAAWHLLNQGRDRKQRLIQTLGADKRAIGPLLLLLHPEQLEEVTDVLQDVLKQLLPRLQAEDFLQWSPPYVEALLGMLVSKDKELVLQVLKTLEHVGDKRALAPVATLLAQTDKIHVRRAAQDCLTLLTARAQQQVQASTLLRPSDPGSVSQETLLRPTLSDNTETPQEQLLRSVDQG